MKDEAEVPEFEPAAFRPRSSFDYEAIKSLVGRFFKVYESEANIGGPTGGEIAAFYVQADPAVFAERFDQLRETIRQVDPNLMVILQYRGGEDIILVARKPPVISRGTGLNLILFVATILTTTLAGAIFYTGYEQAEDVLNWGGVDLSYLHPKYLALGFLSFSFPVMLILGIHELGHFFVAKRHRVRTSLPYFIPVPPIVPIGTFGAFISIREPIPDRKALFDIGAAGPIAGFLTALPVLALGLVLTGYIGAPIPLDDELRAELRAPDGTLWGYGHEAPDAVYGNDTVERDGDDHLHEWILVNASSSHFAPGEWFFRARPVVLEDPTKVTIRISYQAPPDHAPTTPFQLDSTGNYSVEISRELADASSVNGDLLFQLPSNATSLTAEFFWPKPPSRIMQLGTSLLFQVFAVLIPTPDDVLIHPTGFAGWVGLLVTGFNLLPAGQLDGGHVARAVLGDRMRWASYASVAAMFLLSYFFTGWLVMALLIVFLGVRHPPPLNDKTELDANRKLLAFLVLVILVVSFIPVPFSD